MIDVYFICTKFNYNFVKTWKWISKVRKKKLAKDLLITSCLYDLSMELYKKEETETNIGYLLYKH